MVGIPHLFDFVSLLKFFAINLRVWTRYTPSLWGCPSPVDFVSLLEFLEAVVELGGDDDGAAEGGVHLSNHVHPQAAAPLHAGLLQEEDQPAFATTELAAVAILAGPNLKPQWSLEAQSGTDITTKRTDGFCKKTFHGYIAFLARQAPYLRGWRP